MRYREVGSSDLEVSEIGLGSWLTYAGGVGLDRARECVFAALDCGITFFDTANEYGRGAAESAWGEIFENVPRDSYVLATKVWAPMSDDPGDRGLSSDQILKQLHASLRRLRTDYIDLYQAHRFDVDTPLEETIEAFQAVVASGKVRQVGFSEWSPRQIVAAVDIAGPDLFVSSQPQYSMLWQVPEDEVFPQCDEFGISHVVWSPLAQGLLSGKYKPGAPPPPDSRAANPDMNFAIGLVMNDDAVQAAERLSVVAARHEIPMVHLALAWVLRHARVASAIVGASSPEQVRHNAGASGTFLSEELLSEIDEALGDAPVRGQRLGVLAQEGVTYRNQLT